jgi:hypothetical protein
LTDVSGRQSDSSDGIPINEFILTYHSKEQIKSVQIRGS